MGRRAFLLSATVVATLSTGLATTGVVSGAPGRAAPAPETVALPDGIRPEGITSGPDTTYYVGSLADGRIVTGDLLAGTSEVLLPGQGGGALRGLVWDSRSNLVWAAGNEGATAHVYAVDAGSGAIASDTVVAGGRFLDDLVVNGIVGGDGLERDGSTLYNVRGSGPDQVAVLVLSQSGGAWQAKWLGARTDETLDVPTTATVAGGWLWAVNARFSTPGATEFWITRPPARRQQPRHPRRRRRRRRPVRGPAPRRCRRPRRHR